MSSYDPNDPTRPVPSTPPPTGPPPTYDPAAPPWDPNQGAQGAQGVQGPTGDYGGAHVATGGDTHVHRTSGDGSGGHWMDKVNHFMPLAMAALLALIFLVTLIDLIADEEERDENRDGICIQYSYDGDSKLSFSEMNPQQRAIADNYDCDVDGRDD